MKGLKTNKQKKTNKKKEKKRNHYSNSMKIKL